MRDRAKWKEADEAYRDAIERGFKWDREHPDNQIGASYASSAYRGRLTVFVKANPDDTAGAEKLIDEIVKHVPLTTEELREEVRVIRERM
jgi:hypothetical protein